MIAVVSPDVTCEERGLLRETDAPEVPRVVNMLLPEEEAEEEEDEEETNDVSGAAIEGAAAVLATATAAVSNFFWAIPSASRSFQSSRVDLSS